MTNASKYHHNGDSGQNDAEPHRGDGVEERSKEEDVVAVVAGVGDVVDGAKLGFVRFLFQQTCSR